MSADLSRLLEPCAEAAEADAAEVLRQEAEAAAEAVAVAREQAGACFGGQAAEALGSWHPTDAPPGGAIQMYVRLAPRVLLRFTAPAGGGAWFEVLADCDLGHCHATTVRGLAELGAALSAAGVF